MKQKICTPRPKIFFLVQAKRLAESCKLWTGLVVLTGPEKLPHKATCVSVFLENPRFQPDAKVLTRLNTNHSKVLNLL